MKNFLVLLLAVVFISSANAQYKSLELTDTTKIILAKPKLLLKPEAKFDDMIGQFGGGNMGGILLGLGGASLGYLIETGGHRKGEMAGLGGALIGLVTGHCAGSILGVYAVGSSKDVSGNIGSTILGGIAGTAGGIGFLYVVKGATPYAYLSAAFPTMGAMVGFNSTLYYKDKKNVSELKDLGSQLKIKNDFELQVLKLNFQLPKESEISKIPERFLLALK